MYPGLLLIPLIWYATWPCSENWIFDPSPRPQGGGDPKHCAGACAIHVSNSHTKSGWISEKKFFDPNPPWYPQVPPLNKYRATSNFILIVWKIYQFVRNWTEHSIPFAQGKYIEYFNNYDRIINYDRISTNELKGAQWLSGRVLDSRPKGRGFEPHRRHCVVVLEQDTFIPG